MEHLLQRLIPNKYQDLEPSSHTVISPLIVRRGLQRSPHPTHAPMPSPMPPEAWGGGRGKDCQLLA